MKVVLNNILVKEIKEDVKSSGGIILGDGSDIKFHRGVIKAVGENISKVKEGDVVYFDRHRIYPINYNGDEYLVMNYENVVLIED
jgi:co-chaperonin GroES (HSP10)